MKILQSALPFLALAVVCGGVTLKIKTIIHAPKRFALRTDNHCGFSKKMLARLNLFAKEQEKLSLSPQLFSTITKETFPAISAVTLRSSLTGQTQVTLTSAKPVALINKECVLANNNQLVEYDVFPEESIKHLPLFHVAQSQKDRETFNLSDRCKKFVRTFDRSLLEKYEVQWVHETEIMLQDKQYPRVSMLIDDATTLTPALQLAYQEVRNKMLEKETKSKGRDWLIDVRFRNQIIVFPRGQRV